MNAPAKAGQLAPATLSIIPLDKLFPSTTHVQELRRKRFDKVKLQELADSITKVGVLQPIVVRPKGDAAFEIVAGERRWLASKIAGATSIGANVTELSDDQVLEVQLVENLQREGLHEMEEAEGYDELMKLRKLKPEDIADLVGRSRSHIYGRLKLLQLCPEARAAFYGGKIESTKAMLIARIGHHDTQRKALKDLTQDFRGGGPMSYREAHRHVLETYMLKITASAFDPENAELVPKAGKCSACPKRTGNQADLFTDVKDPNVCTDPKCYEDKREAHAAIRRKKFEDAGDTVIIGAAAKKIRPNDWSNGLQGGYVNPDQETYLNGKFTTPRKVLGDQLPRPAILEDPHTGKLVPIVKQDALAKAYKAAGIKTGYSGGTRSRSDASRLAAERKARIETVARMRIFNAITAASLDRQFTEEDTRLVAADYIGRLGFDSLKRLVDARNLAAGVEKPKGHDYVNKFERSIEKMPLAELGVLMLQGALCHEIQCHAHYGGKPDDLHATAKRLKIDHEKIRRETQAEFEAKKKAKAKPPPKEKAAPAKKAKSASQGKRAARTAFMQPHYAKTPAMQALIGTEGITRTDVTKKVWAYIKKHGLQDKTNRRMINTDATMLAVFGGKKQVSMFDMTQILTKQLTTKASEVKPA